MLGPKAGGDQWSEPLEKFKVRVREIRADGLSPGMAASRFATRAVPVLGYKAQLCAIPHGFAIHELWAAHKILGMPLSLDSNAICGLDVLGGTKLVRPSNYMRSCNMRAGLKTLAGFEQMHNTLCCWAIDGVMVGNLGSLRPPGWDSDAGASQLF